jgi:hypothetical protein
MAKPTNLRVNGSGAWGLFRLRAAVSPFRFIPPPVSSGLLGQADYAADFPKTQAGLKKRGV